MDSSAEFEQQIQRIHALIEDTNAEVTWNDKIPDPDNPKQDRQIDVSIKNGDKLTHIECRFRGRKQDVQWVEELMGRKESLGADCVIGVSSSGFTEGAILKAQKRGIILREFKDLTPEEVVSWGKTKKIILKIIKIENPVLNLRIPEPVNPPYKVESKSGINIGSQDYWIWFLNALKDVAQKLTKDKGAEVAKT